MCLNIISLSMLLSAETINLDDKTQKLKSTNNDILKSIDPVEFTPRTQTPTSTLRNTCTYFQVFLWYFHIFTVLALYYYDCTTLYFHILYLLLQHFHVRKLYTSMYFHSTFMYFDVLLQYLHVRKLYTFMYFCSTSTYCQLLPQYFYVFLRTTTVLSPSSVLSGTSTVLPCTKAIHFHIIFA